MDFRNISAWSIRNPIIPIVLFAALLLMGVFSFVNMKVQGEPDVEFPAALVMITQPGAAPTEIENQITTKVEAMEDGYPGQSIRVRNPLSKREFRGVVQGEDSVLIPL